MGSDLRGAEGGCVCLHDVKFTNNQLKESCGQEEICHRWLWKIDTDHT